MLRELYRLRQRSYELQDFRTYHKDSHCLYQHLHSFLFLYESCHLHRLSYAVRLQRMSSCRMRDLLHQHMYQHIHHHTLNMCEL